MSKWKVEFDSKAQKEFLQLDKKIQQRIIQFLEKWAVDNPRVKGAPLHGTLSGLWRYRIGNYRVICKVEDSKFIVLIISTKHRKEVYKTVKKVH